MHNRCTRWSSERRSTSSRRIGIKSIVANNLSPANGSATNDYRTTHRSRRGACCGSPAAFNMQAVCPLYLQTRTSQSSTTLKQVMSANGTKRPSRHWKSSAATFHNENYADRNVHLRRQPLPKWRNKKTNSDFLRSAQAKRRLSERYAAA